MIRKRFGSIFVLLFFLSVLTGGIIYDDLSTEAGDDPYQAIKLLNEAIHQVAEKYVDPIAADSLYFRAMEGMLLSLDPYSQLMTPDDYNDLRISTEGNYEGLGIQIDVRDEILTVVAPIEGTPAYKAGLRAGDQILAVDGTPTTGWTVEKAVQELRGPGGSRVELTIGRIGLDETMQVGVTRQAITLSAVPYAFMLGEGVGYVRFRQFSENGRDEVRDAVRRLERQGLRALILDVRGNPGGLLDQAIDVSDLFLPRGVEIVSTRGRAEQANRTYQARDNDDFSVHPMVVLIDRSSASASEILAGALQDHDRALVVGQSTWGKGLVQSLFPLDDGYFLKLTTARYYTPSGRSIQRGDESEIDMEALSAPDEYPIGGVGEDFREDVPDSLIFRTKMGRRVYGGGGVMPDVIVRPDELADISQDLLRQITLKNAFFGFGVQYRATHPEVPRNFAPDEGLLEEFREYLREEKSIDFTDAAFEAERAYLRDLLRYTLISQYHGEGAARQAVMRADLPLAKAMELLTEADTLADLFRLAREERAAAIDAQRTASAPTASEGALR